MIRTHKIIATPAGAAGSATVAQDSPAPINGELVGIYMDYASQPSSTDVVFATKGAPVKTLLTLTNVNADGWYYPRAQVHDTAGAALTLDGTRANVARIPLDDYVTMTVSQGDPVANGVTAYLLVDDGK